MLSRPFCNPIWASVIVLVTVLCLFSLTQWHKVSDVFSDSAPVSFVLQQTNIGGHNDPKWFLGIFVGPDSISRRGIIRSTWASRYAHPTHEYRFIVGNYTNTPWAAVIDAENATYGDIWAMPEFTNENYETANTIKNLEFFSYMAKQQASGQIRRYDFVSKIDDDNWFNLPVYRNDFMVSRLKGGKNYRPEAYTVIARPFAWSQHFVYPSGRIYTVSWPMVEFYAKKYAAHSERALGRTLSEDQILGFYPFEDQLDLEFVVMEYEQAYDVGVEYILTSETDTLTVHSIKDDELFLEIGTLFDDNGKWNGKKIEGKGVTSWNRTIPEMIRRFGAPTDEELLQLQAEWAKGPPEDPFDSLDWKLVHDSIEIEDRERLGRLYPLTLHNNNASTGCVPKFLDPNTHYLFDP